MKSLIYKKFINICVFAVVISAYCSTAIAANSSALWQLNSADSKIAYGSIKKDTIGELNHFRSFSGHISAKGEVNVKIDLSSVETFIAIRNERMIKHVFGDKITATLSAIVDTSQLALIAVGGASIIDVNGVLSLLGKDIPIETSMYVAKLGKDRLLVTTDSMIMLKTAELGVDAGVSKLMEIAKLPSITRVVPISLRFVFDKRGGVAMKNTVSKKLTSNLASAKGKKIFMQCQACHNLNKEVNTIGPHLVGILGRKAGSVKGFSYSGAMKSSGITWDVASLKKFLAEPMKMVPGNKMPFVGLKKQQDIDNLVTYIEVLN